MHVANSAALWVMSSPVCTRLSMVIGGEMSGLPYSVFRLHTPGTPHRGWSDALIIVRNMGNGKDTWITVRWKRKGMAHAYWYCACVLVWRKRIGMAHAYWNVACVLVWRKRIGMAHAYWYGACVLVWRMRIGVANA